MIVSFSVSNFRSFKEEQTLSLVASRKLDTTHESHTAPIPDSSERVLRASVIYGANGAGKSNLFLALRYFKELAIEQRTKGIGTGLEPFQFSRPIVEDSTFDIQFIADGKLFRYGFTVNDRQISEEWLARIVGSKERTLYERTTSAENVVVVAKSALKPTMKLKALCSIGGPANQTFLATARATLKKDDLGPDLLSVWRWFTHSLTTIAPDETFGPLGHQLSEDASFLKFAGDFLKSASTGVDHLEVSKLELTEEQLKQHIPDEAFQQIMNPAMRPGDIGLTLIKDSSGREFVIDRKGDKHFHQIAIASAHIGMNGEPVSFTLDQESDGTRRLLDLIPTLHDTDDKGSVFVIDEVDRSLHPILVRKIVEFFLKSCTNSSQMLVTTHESSLLDLALLRRDEIWFAEKDKTSATHLYSLNDYKVRNDLEIRKHYLQGRFGAIPFLANLDRLLPVSEPKPDA